MVRFGHDRTSQPRDESKEKVERVKLISLLWDTEWHTHAELSKRIGNRYGARIGELRDDGWDIEDRESEKGRGKDYRLVALVKGKPRDLRVRSYLYERDVEELLRRDDLKPEVEQELRRALISFRKNTKPKRQTAPRKKKKENREMKLFTLTRKQKEGCEASRCKETEEISTLPGDLWGRKIVKLCVKHANMAMEFAEANPDYNPSGSTALAVVDPELGNQLKEYEQDAQEALEILRQYPITGQKDLEDIGEWLREVKLRRNWLETKEKEITKPINTSLQRIRDLFRPAKTFWADMELLLKAKISEITLLEEQRNQKALQEAADAAGAGDSKAVSEATSKMTTVGDLSGISTTVKWTYKVVDAAKIPRSFLKVDDAKLREHCRKFKADQQPTPVAGVEFVPDVSVRARAS